MKHKSDLCQLNSGYGSMLENDQERVPEVGV